jgi:predicted dehydrogenase
MNNGKIGVGIIGVHPAQGWASMAHLPALQSLPDYEIVALTNRTRAVAEEAARKFGIPHYFTSHEDLFALPEVDLVVITVKVPYHFELARDAIRAGKSIYCEWPLGNGLEEGQALQRLAAQHNVRAVVGLQSRATAEMRYVRDLIRDGYVGDVLSATLLGSGIIGGAMIPSAFAYTLDPVNGAGIINVGFAHAIDALCFALDSSFDEVSATVATRRKTAQVVETGATVNVGTPDQIAISGTLKSGAVVSAHVRGGMSRGANFRLEINGTRGDLVITNPMGYPGLAVSTIMGGQDLDMSVSELVIPSAYRGSQQAEPGMATNVGNSYALLADDFRTGGVNTPTFEDAVTLHQLIDAIERSAGRGSRVKA